MRVTLRDIAAKVGVDPSAVSLALSDRTAGKLSAQRVRQIRKVANEVGYRPNLSATHLRRGSTQCIGVVLTYLDHYPFNNYFNLISQACVKHGYYAVPLAVGRKSLFDSSQTLDLGRVHVDGMIVLDYIPEDPDLHLEDRVAGHPLVCRLADPTLPLPNCPSIVVDYYEGIRALLRHVVGRGWRKIRFIVEDDPTRPHSRNHGRLWAAHEERAIADAARDFDLPLDYQQTVIRTPERGAKARYETMMRFLSHRRLEAGVCLVQDGADGISGTYAALTKMGYTIGKDVAVAAMAAIPAWEHVEPVVTFSYERYEEISRLMVDLAVDGIEQRGKYARDARFDYSTAIHDWDSVPDITGRSQSHE